MRIDVRRVGLDKDLKEVKVIVKYDSIGVNKGTFYVDSDGEHEMSERLANEFFNENAVLRSE